MTRTADYTIKGFLYQFNKTLIEILKSPNESTITIEGIIEDLEVASPSQTIAIQCKYHEAKTNFTQSDIFEPLLQMMCHFHANQSFNVRYVLFAHFPGAPSHFKLCKDNLKAAIASGNKDLKKYIQRIRRGFDHDKFLQRFAIQFGPAYDELVEEATAALAANGFLPGDVDTLAYPNAIHLIASLSIRHEAAKRKTTRKEFVHQLQAIRSTAISRWTMALRSRKALLDARRKQLKMHLDTNSRLRYFVIDSSSLEDYAAEIVLFIRDFIDKYHFKAAHINTPILCLCTPSDDFRDVQYRLFTKGVITTDGYIGKQFDESWFFRDPICRKGPAGTMKREFSLRLLRWEDHGAILSNRKCDDLFIIGEPNCTPLSTEDVNVERLAPGSLKEVKYIMGVSNVYE